MLPSDRYIALMLGFTDEQYEQWKDFVRAEARKGPQPSVVCGEPATTLAIVSLVLTIVGTGFQIIAALLAPRPRAPGRIDARQIAGKNQTNIDAFAPRAGFNAVQDVAAIGAPIPVIYTNRETINGVIYGGVRANLSLLWAQILSLGGSQMLRAVFMIGEGDIASIDANGFAIGDNSIASYDLGSDSGNSDGARITIYYRANGGRIASTNRLAGRADFNDRGNAANDGAADVFMARGVNGTYGAVFSAVSKPSTSTTFGLYQLIGNNLGIKRNPVIRPAVTARLKPRGKKGNSNIVCDKDQVAEVERDKDRAFFSSRSGVISGSFGLGNTFTYRLDRSSDYETLFQSVAGGGTWVSSRETQTFPKIYQVDTDTKITGFNFTDRMTVGTAAIASGGDAVTVVATFDVATVRDRLISQSAARGQYVVEYFIRVRLDDNDTPEDKQEVLESEFAITITIQSNKEDQTISQTKNNDGLVTNVAINAAGVNNTYIFEGDVDDDSGPVIALTGPDRLQATINFPFEDLDAFSETAADVASTVAGRQKGWDDGIVVGDLYKCGSALAVCTGRSPSDKIFVSDSEDGANGTGQTIDATFRVARAGSAATVSSSVLTTDGLTTATRQTATSGPHLMRCALGTVSTTSECRIVEIGLRSTLNIRTSGLCNFRDSPTLTEVDGRACIFKEGFNVKRGKKVNLDIFQSGVVSTVEERYSFFRVSFREAGTSTFTQLSECFGVRGGTEQASFNYLSLQMPSQKRWEYRFEPLSGWEIRSNTASGTLVVLDAKLSSVITGSSAGISWRVNGEIVSRDRSTFAISTTKRDTGLGIPRPDDNNYVDAWGKLAESFVYEEVRSSATGPEHEIVYVNEIRENARSPQYTGIALVGINAVSAFEWQQFSQFSAYVTGGAKVRRLLNSLTSGASHLFPDIALDRFTNAKYGPGRITDDLIDIASFQAAAQWCQDRKYFFDGPVMLATDSPRQWTADVAATMLLDFKEVNGKYSLSPSISFSPIAPKALFTAGNIAEDSFKFETIPIDDLQPVNVSVKWREERGSAAFDNPGLFPEAREILVREAAPNGSDGNPQESIDLSDYVTNENHAIDVAKFRIRAKRLRDHVVSFATTYDGLEGICSELYPGDYIRVAMDTFVYNQFNNGAVMADGTVVSTQDLAAGSYNVIAWDGTSNDPTNTALVVAGDGTATPTGIIFTVKQTGTEVRTYQVLSISPTDAGTFSIEAIHSPVDASGNLLMAANWDNAGSWVIQR